MIHRTLFPTLLIYLLPLLPTLSSAQSVQVAPDLTRLEATVVETVDRVEESVIAIVMRDQAGNNLGSGSGVIVTSDGLILTAAHVVDNQTRVIAIMSDNSEHEAEVLGMNRFKDAALCRMVDIDRQWPHSPIGDSDSTEVTSWVIAMGHGRGHDETRSAPVRFGRVRAHNPGRFLTTDCPLIGGDSGGPLFNLTGEVIAINSSINGLARFNVHAGVSGFKDDMERMLNGDRWGKLMPNVIATPETPILGVQWIEGRRSFFSRQDPRPIIGYVAPNGPADKAGLQQGDLIVKLADEEVSTALDVEIALGRQKAGNAVPVIIQRNRQLLQTSLTLQARSEFNNNYMKVPQLGEGEDSPFVKEQDKAKLSEQIAEVFQWAKPLEAARSNTYIQLYAINNIRRPLLNATIIDDETALAPLSAFKNLPAQILAWRPGLDALPVKLVGGYEEHDLAVLSIPGLRAEHDLLSTSKTMKLGEFIGAISKNGSQSGLSKLGVVSVETRDLKPQLGVYGNLSQKGKGALLTDVAKGNAAYQMGLRKGDLITKFNGIRVKGFGALVTVIESLKVGDEVEVEFTRNGESLSTKSRIGAKGNDSARINIMDQMGQNSLSSNTNTFRTVLQSDILVEPEECGSPVFALDGAFAGVAISDAGRNKTYILPAGVITEALSTPPRPVQLTRPQAKVARRTLSPQPQLNRPSQGTLDEFDRLRDELLKDHFGEDSPFQEFDRMFDEIFGR